MSKDLERRVEALEKELQVLKGQIQATLLDIQEQILTNAYPTLRAENATTLPERPAPSAASPITILASTPGGPARPDPREEEEDAGPVNVRKVSLTDLGDEPAAPPPAKARPAREPAPREHAAPAQDLDLTTLSRLEEWATEKLEHMGVARTKQLIRMYAEQGRFTPDVEATLLKFVSIYEETTGPLPAPPPRASAKARPAAPQNGSAAPANAPRARKSADDDSAPQANSGNPARPANNPAVKTVPAEPTPRKKGSAEPPQARPVDKAGPPPAADDDEQASVVLKLIAGIQNAGAGVQWRKKDG